MPSYTIISVRFAALALAVLLALMGLAACGQVVTRPTPHPATPTATLSPTPTLTPRATATPAPYTPEPTATPTVTPTPIIHRIESGETLIAIAGLYGVSVQAIQDANGIIDPRALRVGQMLVIPNEEEDRLGAGTSTPDPTPLPIQVSAIHFGSGDTGNLWALGEVTNPGPDDIEGVSVAVTLFDDAGDPLASEQALAETMMLPAGATAPFGVLFTDPPAHFNTYSSEVLAAYAAHLGFYYLDLQAENIAGSGERYFSYRVTGDVANSGPEDAAGVRVVVTLYDALDQVIGFRSVEPEHNVISPGGHTTFLAEIVPLGGPVARIGVTAQGRRLPTPTPTS